MVGSTTTTNGDTADDANSDWLSGWHLDAVVTTLSVLMVAGVAWDFRTHASGISFAEEGFFTEPHVFFYTMFLGIAAAIGAGAYRNRRRGVPFHAAVPEGYAVGVLGVGLFFVGGGGDYVWHSTFGFEQGVEALTSPTHLLLATGAALFLASPLRATWRRPPGERGSVVPALVSAGLVLTVPTMFTAYVNPLIQPVAFVDAGGFVLVTGVAGVMVYSAILVGGSLVLLDRLDLPAGAFTLVFAIVGLVNAAVELHLFFLPAVVVAGLLADALVGLLGPSRERVGALRLFAAAVPVGLFVGYFATVELVSGIAWTVHVWAGAVVLAGAAGLLVSYVAVPDGAASPADH